MDRVFVTIKPTSLTTRLLVTLGNDDVLKAVLPPPSQMHRLAAPTLLEGMSLWFGRRLSVVLCVAGKDESSELNLCDGLGYGKSALHYEVEVVAPGPARTGRRIQGLGGFHDLRQLSLRGLR